MPVFLDDSYSLTVITDMSVCVNGSCCLKVITDMPVFVDD